jgi:hypothetical protein
MPRANGGAGCNPLRTQPFKQGNIDNYFSTTIMAEQTEKAFQKQPLFQNTKARGESHRVGTVQIGAKLT